MKLIDKDKVVAEIEKRLDKLYNFLPDASKVENGIATIPEACNTGKYMALESFRKFLDTLEVKEVDLEKEIKVHIDECLDVKFPTTNIELIKKDVEYTARKFFELGLKVNNPTTAVDRGIAEEIIVNLKRIEQDYCIDLTKEMQWLRDIVKKGE